MSGVPQITLEQLMTRHAVSVSMDDSLARVRELFEHHRFHHLLVVDNHKLVGVISDRDLLKHISPFVGHVFSERTQDLATLHRRVHQIMSRKPIVAPPLTTLEEAIRVFLDQRISCLPVVDEHGHPLGIVTLRDILHALVPPDQ